MTKKEKEKNVVVVVSVAAAKYEFISQQSSSIFSFRFGSAKQTHLNRSVIFCSCCQFGLWHMHTYVYEINEFVFFLHVILNFETSFQLSGCTNNRPKIVLIFNLNMKWHQVDKLVIRMTHTSKAQWWLQSNEKAGQRACHMRWSIDFPSFEYTKYTHEYRHTYAYTLSLANQK